MNLLLSIALTAFMQIREPVGAAAVSESLLWGFPNISSEAGSVLNNSAVPVSFVTINSRQWGTT